MKAKRFLSPVKFVSTVFYMLIVCSLLLALTQVYASYELTETTIGFTSITFAFAITICGFAASTLYYLFSLIINAMAVIICRKNIGKCGLSKLSDTDTTLISIASCLILGYLFHELTVDQPSLSITYELLWSLPLGKLAFINTKPSTFFGEIRDMICKSPDVLVYTTAFIAVMLADFWGNSLLTLLVSILMFLMLILGFMLKVPIKE